MRIAVAGGTGLMGQLVVAELRGAGHEPVVLARSKGVDRTTGAGLSLEGCAAVIDVSNVTTMSASAASEFFEAVTRHLLEAGARAGVQHVVALSIVGVDRVPLGYYQGKLHQEKVLAAGSLPWTVLRATQFHEFAGQTLARMRGPVAPIPRMITQPVAGREVAAHLVSLAAGPAQGQAKEIAGPERLRLIDMCRGYQRIRGRRKLLVSVPLPGEAGRGMASGGLLPAGEYVQGVETFDSYLGAS